MIKWCSRSSRQSAKHTNVLPPSGSISHQIWAGVIAPMWGMNTRHIASSSGTNVFDGNATGPYADPFDRLIRQGDAETIILGTVDTENPVFGDDVVRALLVSEFSLLDSWCGIC